MESANASGTTAEIDKAKSLKKMPRELLSFQPDVVELEHAPLPGGARWTLYVVLALILATIIWATWAKVDRTVVAQGRLIATDMRIQVQPLSTAVVREIHVATGDIVDKGQVLVTLDPTFAQADLSGVENRLSSLLSQMRRLQAELDGQEYIPQDDETTEPAELQRGLYEQRKREFEARVTQSQERVSQLEEALRGNLEQQKNLAVREELLREVEEIQSNLYSKSHVSRLQYLEAQDKRLEITSQLNQLRENLQRLQHELAESKAEQDAFRATWQRELATNLDDIRSRYLSARQEYEKAMQMRSLVTLKAPADAIVLEVGQFVPGSVAREAETLVSLVPLNSGLEVMANVPAMDIGRIRVGDEARVKLNAFPFQRHGTLPGEVRIISEDAFQEESAQGAVQALTYRSRIRLLSNELKDVPESYRLQPGMEASVEIKVGERRVIEYLIYPIIRAMGESMREP